MTVSKRMSGGGRAAWWAGLACATFVLAACSGDSGGKGDQPVKSDDLVSSMSPAKGDVDLVKWNLDSEPDTLDPANAATYPSGTVVKNLCDPLLTVDADYNLSPYLADYEVVDPRTIVFTVRDDATFWDGTPVTAEDVAFSMQRYMKPDYILSFVFANVRSVEVTGANQVTVSFKTPDELFINEMPAIVILEKAFTERAGDDLGTPSGGIMCSGPFELKDWTSGRDLTITRNDAYWNADRRAFAKTVQFSWVGDGTALTQALAAGEIDGAYEISAAAVPALRKATVGRLTFGPSMQSTNLNIANPGGVLGDPKIREAMQVAIDRESMADVIFNGAAAPVYTAVTPETWPNDQKPAYQAAYDRWAETRAYDPAAGKSLVAESGYDGTRIVLAIQAGDETSSRAAQLIQQQLKAVGLQVRIQSFPPLVFSQAGYDATKRKGMDVMLTSNFNGAHDPVEFIGFSFLPGSPYNYTDLDDPQLTKLIEDARQTFDSDQRAQMLIEAQDLYEADNDVIPLVSTYTTTFLNDRLTGAVTSFAYWSMPALAYVGAAK